MKNVVLVYFGLLLINTAVSQQKSQKFSIDAYAQPSINYWFESGEKNFIDEHNIVRFSLDAGLLFNYSFTEKFTIGAGFAYLKRGETSKMMASDIVMADPNDPAFGDIEKLILRYNLYYISVPVRAKYMLLQLDKTKFSANIGLGVDYLLGNKNISKVVYDDGEIYRYSKNMSVNTEYINRWSLSGSMGVEISHALYEKFELWVAPDFNSMLTPYQKSSSARNYYTYYWKLGCRVGVRMKF